MSDDPQEPTPPHSPAQERWIESHKADTPPAPPEESLLDFQLRMRLPRTAKPMDVIERAKAQAVDAGGAVIENDNGLAHVEGHTASCACPDCFAKNEHHCHCASCYSPVRPSAERKSTHHYSVYFGDSMLNVVRILDGGPEPKLELMNNTVEVNIDEEWAIVLGLPPHMCRNCWRSPCLQKVYGEFGVRLEKS